MRPNIYPIEIGFVKGGVCHSKTARFVRVWMNSVGSIAREV
jgi:hypothetical protein